MSDVTSIAFGEHPELGTCSEFAVVYFHRPSKPALHGTGLKLQLYFDTDRLCCTAQQFIVLLSFKYCANLQQQDGVEVLMQAENAEICRRLRSQLSKSYGMTRIIMRIKKVGNLRIPGEREHANQVVGGGLGGMRGEAGTVFLTIF